MILNHFNINLTHTQRVQAALVYANDSNERTIKTDLWNDSYTIIPNFNKGHLSKSFKNMYYFKIWWIAKALSFWGFLKEITQQSCTSRFKGHIFFAKDGALFGCIFDISISWPKHSFHDSKRELSVSLSTVLRAFLLIFSRQERGGFSLYFWISTREMQAAS